MSNPKIKYRRKKKYLSHKIQGSLLIAMVILELILISSALVYLYFAFNEILEQQIFSIHRTQQENTFNLMLLELVKTVLVLSMVNIIALLTAHVLWSKYVKFVINAFRNELNLIAKFMLYKTNNKDQKLHEVIEKLDKWEELEISRCKKLLVLIRNLKAQVDAPETKDSKKQILQLSKSIEQLLPIENTSQ